MVSIISQLSELMGCLSENRGDWPKEETQMARHEPQGTQPRALCTAVSGSLFLFSKYCPEQGALEAQWGS